MLFFAVDFLAVDFLAGEDFFAVDELDDFFAGEDFFAVDELEDFLAGEDFFAVDEPEDFLAGEDFFAVDELDDFLAGEDFFAVDELEDFLAGEDFFAVDFFAVEELEDFLAVLLPAPAAFLAAAAPFFTASVAAAGAARVSLGSFLAPETTSLSCAPGLNAGTAFFFAFIRSPVEGLRTQRASRTRFSNEPKPVMATFSPLATSRVMVSSTDSSACAAAFRLPS